MKFKLFSRATLALLSLSSMLFLSSCDKDDDDIINPPTPPGPVLPNQIVYGLTSTNQLVRFNANNSAVNEASVAITGLQAGENLTGIDFRPATGELFGIGSTSRLYSINKNTGAARAIGAAAFTPAATSTNLGFDFNPTVDRIRLIGSDGQNLRLNPETGTVAFTDGVINGQAGATISAVAYSGNTAGSTATTLYAIESSTKKLYRLAAPNAGTVTAIGDLGVSPSGVGGFDISSDGKVSLASLTVGTETGLYQIDTTSGKATKLGVFASAGGTITDIAIAVNPVAYATDNANNLIVLNTGVSTNLTVISKPITGLQAGENIVGIDMRPLTGGLYALGSTSRLYVINANTGAATIVGTAGAFTLNGTSFGFDFNPTVDRIRIVSNTGQNLRISPIDGTLSGTDTQLTPVTDVTAAAYTNNFAGATTTVLYEIDGTTNMLYSLASPNNGILTAVGSLGADVTSDNGFDIGSTSGLAYAIFTVGGSNGLYTVNLTTGLATKVGDISAGTRGFTLGLGN